MEQHGPYSPPDITGGNSQGGEGACKALVFGHGEFDPHSAHHLKRAALVIAPS